MGIKERMAEPEPEPLTPKVGVTYIGTVRRVEMYGKGSEYGEYPAVIFTDDKGKFHVFHAFHRVARSAIERLSPIEGDEIGILYKGMTKDKDRNYEDYRIEVEPAPTA
jgi:hypothetical protein